MELLSLDSKLAKEQRLRRSVRGLREFLSAPSRENVAVSRPSSGFLSRWLAMFRSSCKKITDLLLCRMRGAPKRLIVCETAALGERRMISVIQFEQQRFLIGCGPSSVTLLARLPNVESEEETLKENVAKLDPRSPPSSDGGSI